MRGWWNDQRKGKKGESERIRKSKKKTKRKNSKKTHRQLLRKPLERAQPPVPEKPRQVPVQDHPLAGPRRRVVERDLLGRAHEPRVRRAEAPGQRGLLRRHRRERRAEAPRRRGRQKVVAVERQLALVSHDPSQRPRKKNNVEQRLEGVGIQLGNAGAELLDVLGDPLVGARETSQNARRVVGPVVGVGGVQPAGEPSLERERDLLLEELEAGVDGRGRDGDAGEGGEAAAKGAKVLGDEVAPRAGLDAADLVGEQGARNEEDALEGNEARPRGRRAKGRT